MSIRVTFECACVYLGLEHHPDVDEILGDVLCDMTYVFVESDIYNLPEDPIALISESTGEVECILTQSTWKFPASTPYNDVLELTQVLVSNEIVGRLHGFDD